MQKEMGYEMIYQGGLGEWLVFYTGNRSIYLRSLQGMRAGRCRRLAGDYRDGLTDICHNGRLYYGYRNLQGQLLVRSVSGNEDVDICTIETESGELRSLSLAVAFGKLMLFYLRLSDAGHQEVIAHDSLSGRETTLMTLDGQQTDIFILAEKAMSLQEDQAYIKGEGREALCSICTMTPGKKPELYQLCRSEDQSLWIRSLSLEQERCLELEESLRTEQERSLGLEESLRTEQERSLGLEESLRTEQERSLGLEKSLRTEQERSLGLEESLRTEQERSLELEKDLIVKKKSCTELEKNLQEIQERVINFEDEKEQQRQIMESVKRQYEELMDTAARYRSEAIRWRRRYREVRNQ